MVRAGIEKTLVERRNSFVECGQALAVATTTRPHTLAPRPDILGLHRPALLWDLDSKSDTSHSVTDERWQRCLTSAFA